MRSNTITQLKSAKTINQTIEAESVDTDAAQKHKIELEIYVASHCPICEYALEVSEMIRQRFPAVNVHLKRIDEVGVSLPETVFATPTYLLNGRVWSLGNPSLQQIEQAFG